MMTRDEPDTARLLQQAQQGDSDAVQRLLDGHRLRLQKMIALRMDKRLTRRVDPSDVVQDALVTAHQRMDSYLRSPGIDFYPWLRDIAWKRLMDLHRKHILSQRRSLGRERFYTDELADASAASLVGLLATSQTGPVERLAREELRERVRAAMSRLSIADREVLVLRFVEQLTSRQAAQVLGISETALKGRQIRALDRLRDWVDESFQDR